jgi:hypothetical protein
VAAVNAQFQSGAQQAATRISIGGMQVARAAQPQPRTVADGAQVAVSVSSGREAQPVGEPPFVPNPLLDSATVAANAAAQPLLIAAAAARKASGDTSVRLEGYLTKRAVRSLEGISPLLGLLDSHSWHRRWFVADTATSTVAYYAHEAALNAPLNTLHITPQCVATRNAATSGRLHQFRLRVTGGANPGSSTLVACADSDDEANAWVCFLQAMIERRGGVGSSAADGCGGTPACSTARAAADAVLAAASGATAPVDVVPARAYGAAGSRRATLRLLPPPNAAVGKAAASGLATVPLAGAAAVLPAGEQLPTAEPPPAAGNADAAADAASLSPMLLIHSGADGEAARTDTLAALQLVAPHDANDSASPTGPAPPEDAGGSAQLIAVVDPAADGDTTAPAEAAAPPSQDGLLRNTMVDDGAQGALLQAGASHHKRENTGAGSNGGSGALHNVRLPVTYPENIASFAAVRQLSLNFGLSFAMRIQNYTAMFGALVVVCIAILFFTTTRKDTDIVDTFIVVATVAFGQVIFTLVLALQILRGAAVNGTAANHRLRLARIESMLGDLLVSANADVDRDSAGAGGAGPHPASRRGKLARVMRGLYSQLAQTRDIVRSISNQLMIENSVVPATVLFMPATPALLSTLQSVSVSAVAAASSALSQRFSTPTPA